MKIAIVTLCEAVNYGAYLQAYSTKKFLESYGHKVQFIKSYSLKMIKTTIKALYTYKKDKIKFKNEFRKNFKMCQKQLDKTFKKSGFDAIVIGSDEMWQLLNPTASPKPIFFGSGIDCPLKIAYAVCSNNTTFEDAKKYEYVERGIKGLNAISVRDEETLNTYRPLIGDVPICLDPTFLVDVNKFIPRDFRKPNFNYVLVYTYGFDEEKVKMVKSYAKKRQLKIISVGQSFSWVDNSYACSAFDFLGYIYFAEAVFTDTFHGTILSIQLKKELFSFGYKKKVMRALEQFNLTSRNITAQTDIEELSLNSIDYDCVFNVIDEYKAKSIEFLNENLLKQGK